MLLLHVVFKKCQTEVLEEWEAGVFVEEYNDLVIDFCNRNTIADWDVYTNVGNSLFYEEQVSQQKKWLYLSFIYFSIDIYYMNKEIKQLVKCL